ncbi:MAG: lysoplasmalogenase family protein [Paenirhodobacter sp.]|uniref:lysoplasmalogenase family protein n=1 Tax=Paenirhodobacter sp. TaxID=1965326 RepID=UPI003D0CC6F5
MTLFPFAPLQIIPAAQALIAAALALWQLFAFAAAPPSALKSAVKTGSVAALAVLGAGLGAPGLVVAGLALGAAGDYFLSRPGERAFLAGMAAFAAGHLAYSLWFLRLGAGAPPPMAGLVVALFGGAVLLWIAPRAGALRGPVSAYVGVILAMALAALGLPDHPLATAGALVFVASDLTLALELFVLGPVLRRPAAYLVWALYWPAQALILAAALFPPAG